MAITVGAPESEITRPAGLRAGGRARAGQASHAVEGARVYWYFVVPSLVLVTALIVAPLIYALWLSLRNYSLLLNTDAFVGGANYVRALSDGEFIASLARTLGYVLVVITIDFTFGFAEALLLYELSPRAARIFRGIFLLPILLIPSASAMFWRLVMFGSPNVEFLRILGLEGVIPPLLSDPRWALVGIFITVWWAWSPWVFVLLLGGLEALDRSAIEAAQVDGASYRQIVWRIILPLMKPVIFVTLTFKAVDSFLSFPFIWIMTAGGPGNSTHLMSTFIYQTAFRFLNYGYGSAMAMMMLVISAVLSILAVAYWQRQQNAAEA